MSFESTLDDFRRPYDATMDDTPNLECGTVRVIICHSQHRRKLLRTLCLLDSGRHPRISFVMCQGMLRMRRQELLQ